MLLSHLDRRQKLLECIRKGRYLWSMKPTSFSWSSWLTRASWKPLHAWRSLLTLWPWSPWPTWLTRRSRDGSSWDRLAWDLVQNRVISCHMTCQEKKVAVENLVQQSFSRVLAGSQGCGLSWFGIMKSCTCWGRNRLQSAQKMEELLCRILFPYFGKSLGGFCILCL